MKNFQYKILYCVLLSVGINDAHSQKNTWIETNDGIGEAGTFGVSHLLVLTNNDLIANVQWHKDGSGKAGVYKYDKDNESWTQIVSRDAPNAPQFSFGVKGFFDDGVNVYAMQSQTTLFKLELSTGTWSKIATIPDYNQQTGRIDAWEGKLYMTCSVPTQNGFDNDWANRKDENGEANFNRGEDFVMVFDLETQKVDLLRNPNRPINSAAGGWKMVKVLNSREIFYNSSNDYSADPKYQNGLYQWDGTNWIDITAGLNSINITGNGPGLIWPIRTDPQRNRLFVGTQQGYYEREENGTGWYKYFFREASRAFISPSYLYLYQQGGAFKEVDRAVTTSYPDVGSPTCGAIIGSTSNGAFVTPDDGQTIFGSFQYSFKSGGSGCLEANDGNNQGIYRYIPSNDRPGTVRNLHTQNATYLGGEGESIVSETVIDTDGHILVAGKMSTNMGLTPSVVAGITGINADSKGKIYVMDNTWGKSIEQVIIVGNNIKDIDINDHNEIALVTDQGVVVLNTDHTLKWFAPENTSGRRRVGIANDGKVVASLNTESNGAGIMKLYASDGTEMHKNTVADKNGTHLNDVEISSEHGLYYMIGFVQKNSNLQVAYLYGYELTNAIEREWTTWDFSVGGTPNLQLSTNGADTRGTRIRAVDNGDVYITGETAGGGPGGFTIFAYNGKDLSTKTAIDGNDFYTDGTNSCGPCHITYIGRINPEDGVVKKGKFLHARNLSTGKTNTLVPADLEVDEIGNVYVTGKSAYLFQDRDLFNVNGVLTEPYRGNDQFFVMLSPDMNKRYIWGVFHKDGKTGGVANYIAVKDQKISYVQNSSSGRLITRDDAIRPLPYNQVEDYDTLSANTVFFATWGSKVWETANNDEMTYPFIPADSCFRADALPCVPQLEPGENPLDVLKVFNIISPNSDRINDTWRIDHLDLLSEGYQIRVFTSTGKVVYSNGFQFTENAWDGTDNGDPLPEGIYYYVIKARGIEDVKTGYITLIK